MNLTDLENYFKEHQFANMAELQAYFQKEPEIIRDQLAHWIKKGSVRQIEMNCGQSCPHCHCKEESTMEIYEWIGES